MEMECTSPSQANTLTPYAGGSVSHGICSHCQAASPSSSHTHGLLRSSGSTDLVHTGICMVHWHQQNMDSHLTAAPLGGHLTAAPLDSHLTAAPLGGHLTAAPLGGHFTAAPLDGHHLIAAPLGGHLTVTPLKGSPQRHW